MNRFKLFKAGIDTNEGIKRFNGNAEMYEKYLYRFVDDTNYLEMCKAIESKNVKEAFVAAHSLKGVTGNLSIIDLYNHILPLVEELRVGKIENAPELLKPVTEDYERALSALKDKS